jgi:hypothetical protein
VARAVRVGFVVDKVALGQVFSEFFGFLSVSLHLCAIFTHLNLSSGGWTEGPFAVHFHRDSCTASRQTVWYIILNHKTRNYQTVVVMCLLTSVNVG